MTSDLVQGKAPLNPTIHNSKYLDTKGAILDSDIPRMELEYRVLRHTAKKPGPTDYQDLESTNNLTNLTTKKSTGNTVVGKAIRKSFFDIPGDRDVPGPGNYRIQSDFGMYNPNDIYGWA